MSYNKKTWKNDVTTPFNVESLNDMENRIENGIKSINAEVVTIGKSLDNFTWKELSDIAKAGTTKENGISIGDYKDTTSLNGNTVRMQICGIDTYTSVGASTNNVGTHIDWISVGTISRKPFNSTPTNNGTSTNNNPYKSSEMYSYLQNTLFKSLPVDLQNVIVDKYMVVENRFDEVGLISKSQGTSEISLGKLWLPTEYEIFGSVICGTKRWSAGYGIQYPLFANNGITKMKGINTIEQGRGNYWWLLNSADDSTSDFCIVDITGKPDTTPSDNSYCGVPICFRLGW